MTTLKKTFDNWPIATKLNVVQSIALAILFTVAITWMTGWLTEATIKGQTETVQQINHKTVSMIQVYDHTLERTAARLGSLLKKTLASSYTLDTAQRITVAGVQTPAFRAGNELLNLNFEPIDHFTTASDAVATIFVRDGDEFVRISTSLRKEDGERAIGTKLDRNHPAYAALLANKTFTGKATLFKREYMTHYLPAQDASGTVVGALFIGLDFTEEQILLRQNIRQINLGKNGYMYVLDAGRDAGRMIVHPTMEGKNMYDEKDINGFAYIRSMLEQKNGVLSYWFTNTAAGDNSARERTVVFNLLPEWDWIIVSCLDKEDLAENAISARNLLITGAMVLCVLLFVVVFFTSRRWVTQPLTKAVGAMEKIAGGCLTIEIPEQGNDEAGQLLNATNTMVGKMRSALSNIQAAAQQLADNAEHLVSTAKDVAEQSAQQSDSATTMASGIEEMNANIVHVSDSAKQAHQVSIDSSNISNEGAVVIQQATGSMTRIADTVRTASDVVSTLGRESQAISNIISVIKEIADQTNLLALNAAIEAARAGEQGRGFAVVADEVRKLAERTSCSTQEIGDMICRILDGTANAVTSMQEGVRQVEEGVSYAGQAGGSIASIRQSASQVTAATTSISHALTEQSAAIAEISSNVEKIATMADQNSQTAKESAQYALGLEKLARTLREHVSHFNI
ncbi:MAG: methyl-accepting chemotaxis protein [Betaproteobacteria bacterium]|nr:methyl-accepting chemotaxis protein [Betaproteobacteria bacterium]